MITWEHPLYTKARRRANLAPLPDGWAKEGDVYVHENGVDVSFLCLIFYYIIFFRIILLKASSFDVNKCIARASPIQTFPK